MPREGHLDAIYRIFWYLKKIDPSRIIFDPSKMEVDESLFNEASIDEWKNFYMDAEKPMPINAPKPRGLSV